MSWLPASMKKIGSKVKALECKQDYRKFFQTLQQRHSAQIQMALGKTWNGMEWIGMEWNGMEWNGLEWNGMDWNGMEWNSIRNIFFSSQTSTH